MDGIEIEFLPVGGGERSGDAICLRWGTPGNYKVMVYDGGTQESGQLLVDHIKSHYGTTHVDYMVNSHPDNDHASGLSVVLEQMSVGELWMHQPWNYSDEICHYFRDGRITSASLAARLQQKMRAAYNLEKLAEEKGIPVYEPFAGALIGIFRVLSPDNFRYVHELVPEFEKSPELKEDTLAGLLAKLMDSASELVKKAVSYVAEQWGEEYLPENVETSAENESSVVLYTEVQQKGFLLTGDAGVQTLRKAAECAAIWGFDIVRRVHLAQIPHHGSRRNVSTETLDLLFGPRNPVAGLPAARYAIASAAKEAPTHPKKRVVNAFVRRGFEICATKGQTIRYGIGMPGRPGWTSAPVLEFSTEVEE
ncbi:ComEC/Rec2 family competence protein [Paraburkholderia youngii]|uniref:Metallo-beta-lactamase domain-containing protein n=1 Tax=Paraburkholderia youngii TaxID=2782701 RepID=A0A7Y6MWN7_9BURK|nr:hypothetical protein [Paraburkholderia youngii]NUX98891.1 hypothetical protein [Paraburkholderia youngii]